MQKKIPNARSSRHRCKRRDLLDGSYLRMCRLTDWLTERKRERCKWARARMRRHFKVWQARQKHCHVGIEGVRWNLHRGFADVMRAVVYLIRVGVSYPGADFRKSCISVIRETGTLIFMMLICLLWRNKRWYSQTEYHLKVVLLPCIDWPRPCVRQQVSRISFFFFSLRTQ